MAAGNTFEMLTKVVIFVPMIYWICIYGYGRVSGVCVRMCERAYLRSTLQYILSYSLQYASVFWVLSLYPLFISIYCVRTPYIQINTYTVCHILTHRIIIPLAIPYASRYFALRKHIVRESATHTPRKFSV